MRGIIVFIVLSVTLIGFSLISAGEKPRIGVLRFTNHTSAGWWRGSIGTDLQDMLASELASTKSFQGSREKGDRCGTGEQDLNYRD